MAERFDIHDERSFYLAGIRDLSGRIESTHRLHFLYEIVRDAWQKDAKERAKQKEDKPDNETEAMEGSCR